MFASKQSSYSRSALHTEPMPFNHRLCSQTVNQRAVEFWLQDVYTCTVRTSVNKLLPWHQLTNSLRELPDSVRAQRPSTTVRCTAVADTHTTEPHGPHWALPKSKQALALLLTRLLTDRRLHEQVIWAKLMRRYHVRKEAMSNTAHKHSTSSHDHSVSNVPEWNMYEQRAKLRWEQMSPLTTRRRGKDSPRVRRHLSPHDIDFHSERMKNHTRKTTLARWSKEHKSCHRKVHCKTSANGHRRCTKLRRQRKRLEQWQRQKNKQTRITRPLPQVSFSVGYIQIPHRIRYKAIRAHSLQCVIKSVNIRSFSFIQLKKSETKNPAVARIADHTGFQWPSRKGGATLGAGRDMSPPLLRDVPRRGYNPIYVVHLRGTTAGR